MEVDHADLQERSRGRTARTHAAFGALMLVILLGEPVHAGGGGPLPAPSPSTTNAIVVTSMQLVGSNISLSGYVDVNPWTGQTFPSNGLRLVAWDSQDPSNNVTFVGWGASNVYCRTNMPFTGSTGYSFPSGLFYLSPGSRFAGPWTALRLGPFPSSGSSLLSFVPYGPLGEGANTLALTGSTPDPSSRQLHTRGAQPLSPILVALSEQQASFPILGGILLVEVTAEVAFYSGTTDASGEHLLTLPVPAGLPAGYEVHAQAFVLEGPGDLSMSHGLTLVL